MSNLIVVGRKGCDTDALKKRIQDAGYEVGQWHALTRHFYVREATEDSFTLTADPDILKVENDDKVFSPGIAQTPITIDADFNGAYLPPRVIRRYRPWGMKHFTFPINTFFQSKRSGDGVDIYICDTGVRTDHQELGDRAQDTPTSSLFGEAPGLHGSLVSSCAAGNTVGIAKSALIWDSQISTGGGVRTSKLVDGFDESLSHYNDRSGTNRPAVLNMSFGGGSSTNALETAIADVIDAGIICCFSAGNENADLDSTTYSPATVDPDSVDVGGTDILDAPYYAGDHGTNHSYSLTICAPGQVIYAATAEGTDTYDAYSGTSFSSPCVAGVLACMLEGYGRLRDRADVVALKNKMLANATTGVIQHNSTKKLPDKLVYLDPTISFEAIPGLEGIVLS